MSYITHSKDEFNRTVCKKRKQKRTGLYIQSSPSFHIHFIGKDGDLFIFTDVAPEQVFFKCIFKCISAQSFYFSIHNIDMQCLRFFRQSRHTKNFSGNGYNHFSSVIDYNIFNMELEVVHRAINLRIGRE